MISCKQDLSTLRFNSGASFAKTGKNYASALLHQVYWQVLPEKNIFSSKMSGQLEKNIIMCVSNIINHSKINCFWCIFKIMRRLKILDFIHDPDNMRLLYSSYSISTDEAFYKQIKINGAY